MIPSRQLLSSLFSSLSRHPHWSLTRTLHSDNPADIQGQLRGTASFTPLRQNPANADCGLVYREDGEMPNTLGVGAGMPGLRWSKKYIWRLSEGKISVWFAKVAREKAADSGDGQGNVQEADYLFHEFEFDGSVSEDPTGKHTGTDDPLVTPPQPPLNFSDNTTVFTARGKHLCINDMYRTAYAFRVDRGTGEVLSWSSRHVVKGPKKNQDIVNIYQLEG
ncbi:hypothetical protein PHISP_00485 [Aspergillus sp. HF37]|nr:hypothetical protein PHISP_00485 [Aspergillus sp. HF37]